MPLVPWLLVLVASAAELRGTVTVEGRPLPFVRVEAGSAVAFTGPDGAFSITAPDGASARAITWLRDPEGFPVHLRSAPGAGDLALVEAESATGWAPMDAARRTGIAATDPITADEARQLDLLVTELLANPKSRKKKIPQNAALLGKSDGVWLDRAVSMRQREMDRTGDFAGFALLGDLLIAVGDALGNDIQAGDGHLLIGVSQVLDPPRALATLAQARSRYERALAAAGRPGDKAAANAALAQSWFVEGLTLTIAMRTDEGIAAHERALALLAPLGRPEQELMLRLEIGAWGAIQGDPDAKEHLEIALKLAAITEDLEATARAKEGLADLLDGEAAVEPLREAAAAWGAAGNATKAHQMQVQADQELVDVGRGEEAIADLRPRIPQITDPQVQAAAWRALGDALSPPEQCLPGGEEALRKAMELDTGKPPATNLALDQQLLAQCLWDLDRPAEAEPLFAASAEEWEKLPETADSAAFFWIQAGYTASDAGDDARAQGHWRRAEKIARQSGLKARLAEALNALSMTSIAGDASLETLEAGIAMLEEARTIRAELGEADEAKALGERLATLVDFQAMRLYEEGRRQDALATAERALRIATEIGSAERIGVTHGTLALVLGDLGRAAEAAEHQEAELRWLQSPEARAAWAETERLAGPTVPLEEQIAIGLGRLATLYWGAGDAPKTWDALSRERAWREKAGDRAGVLRSWTLEAIFRLDANDGAGLKKALAEIEKRAKTDDERAIVVAFRMIGPLRQQDWKAFDAALISLQAWLDARKAAARALPADQRQGFVQAWSLLGVVRSRMGDLDLAVDALTEASELAPPDQRVTMAFEIARVYRQQGRLQDALEAMQTVIAGKAELDAFTKPTERVPHLLEVLDTQRALGDAAGAARTLAQIDELGRQIAQQKVITPGDRRLVGDVAAAKARQQLDAGKPADAAKTYEQAFLWYGEFRDERVHGHAVAWLEAKLAAGTAGSGARDEWRALVEKAVDLGAPDALVAAAAVGPRAGATTSDLRWLVDEVRAAELGARRRGAMSALPALQGARARALVALGDDAEAAKAYATALDDLELLRGSIRSDRAKVGFLDAGEARLYDESVALLVKLGRPEEALVASERGRARAFQDLLATAEIDDVLASEPTAAEVADLLARIGVSGAIDLGEASVDVPVDEAALERLKQLRASSDSEIGSAVAAKTPDAAALKALAAAGPIVEYHVTADATYAFLVTKEAVRAVKLPVGLAALDGLVASARADMGVDRARGVKLAGARTSDVKARPDALAALHQQLVAPLGLPEGAPITVVPHGPLYLVPFAALPDASGREWVEKSPVLVAPAIGVLAFTERKKARVAGSGALVVGNPTMPSVPGVELAPLPGAETEAKAIGAALKTTVLSGAAATEEAVTKGVGEVRYVHLATHGLVDDADPLGSFVALAPSPGWKPGATEGGTVAPGFQPGVSDGLLTVGEVFGMKLRADLVALSACQTGLGRVSGDGVMGLGRAFLFAGTPSVLVSLWSVSDEATALQMRVFYEQLAAGKSKAEALQAAQLATRAQYPRPAEWAAFVLVGSP